jgi:hypothetical protein
VDQVIKTVLLPVDAVGAVIPAAISAYEAGGAKLVAIQTLPSGITFGVFRAPEKKGRRK